MALEQWAPRALEQTGEAATKTIQLSAEGTIWETWSAPFKSPDEFVAAAQAVIAAFAAECPKRRIPLLFTALDDKGNIKTQYPSSVQGTNKDADALAGSGGGAAKAFSEAMQGQASLMNTLLAAAKNMVEYCTRVNESLTEQIVDLTAYKHAMQSAEIAAKDSESGVSDFILNQVKELSPMAMQALNLFLESQSKSPAASAAKSGIAAIAQINGVKS